MRENLPRVLIIAVNPLSKTSNNGKTYASFFEGYPSERIAQLYFHRELPNSSITTRFYRVSDEDVLRFMTRRTRSLGAPVEATTIADQVLSPGATRALASSQTIRSARSAVLGGVLRLGYRDIRSWIDDFDPEVIFFSGGDATHLYPLVVRISRDFEAKIFSYVTDDYVLPLPAGNPMAKLARASVRRHFLAMCAASERVLTIGDKMTNVYREQFGIASTPLMNLVEVTSATVAHRDSLPGLIILTYAGGLHLNRWKTLAELGAALDRIQGRGTRAELHIYTSTHIDSAMDQALRSSESIVMHEAVDASQLRRVYESADLLVHVESFERSDQVATYLSVSTKIPEYLAAGRAVLAIGPAGVASMEYLASSGAAYVASSLGHDELDVVVEEAVHDREARADKALRGLEVALANHEAGRSRAKLWEALRDAAHVGA